MVHIPGTKNKWNDVGFQEFRSADVITHLVGENIGKQVHLETNEAAEFISCFVWYNWFNEVFLVLYDSRMVPQISILLRTDW